MSTLHSLVTLVTFICFIGIVIWAWSQHRQKAFDEAAQLPFTDDDLPKGEPHE